MIKLLIKLFVLTWNIIPAVPTSTATVKIQRKSLSRTWATYFQSSMIWENTVIASPASGGSGASNGSFFSKLEQIVSDFGIKFLNLRERNPGVILHQYSNKYFRFISKKKLCNETLQPVPASRKFARGRQPQVGWERLNSYPHLLLVLLLGLSDEQNAVQRLVYLGTEMARPALGLARHSLLRTGHGNALYLHRLISNVFSGTPMNPAPSVELNRLAVYTEWRSDEWLVQFLFDLTVRNL